jgi:hypothetical protein
VKVGDLVRFRADNAVDPPQQLGLILTAALETLSSPARYEVWWMVQNKTGWWDGPRLVEVISEGR